MRVEWLGALLALACLPIAATAQSTGPAETLETGELREITLDEALEQAARGNADLAIARAQEDRADAEARSVRAHLLPQVDLQTGWMRTVDPVGAFGTKLRQGIFGMSDLAIDPLNDPDPITDWSSSARVQWNLLSPQLWAARSAAGHQAEALRHGRRRTAEAIAFRTRVLYWEARRAEEQVRSAVASEEAARATLERFRQRQEKGLLTRADLLQAEAELEAAVARTSQAHRSQDDARDALGVHLGWNGSVVPRPVDPLPEPGPAPAGPFPTEGRADLAAGEAGLRAAESARTRARLTWLPDVGAYAAYVLHDDSPFGSDGEDWTVGVQLQWKLFTGLGRIAEGDVAEADARVARHRLEQARREARSEVQSARRAVQSARRAVEATRKAAQAAEEGRDLMRRRFEEGMATAADLLQAEARTAAMRSTAIDALAGYHMATAQLTFARSENPTEEIR